MKKKILLLGAILLALVTFVASVNALTFLPDYEKNNIVYEEYLKRNQEKTKLAEKIDNYIKEYYKDSFPSYFGGIYINDDATNLILQIVEKNIPDETSKEYSIYNKITNINNVVIEYVNNSYSDLNKFNDILIEYFDENKEMSIILSSFYVDVIKNKVVVELIENSEVQQKDIKNSLISNEKIDSNLMEFIQGYENKFHVNINAGGYIDVGGGYSCSMGFRTKYNGKNGYLTAGHCFSGTYNISSGTFKVVQFTHNQESDYAFVETNSSYIPTNSLAYSNNGINNLTFIPYTTPYFAVGTAIAKSGNTTGYTTGKIQSLNTTVNYSNPNITIKGLVKSNLKSDAGDSGGVVLVPGSGSSGMAIGILSGGTDGFLGIGRAMYFTNIDKLPIEFLNGRY